MEKSGKSGKRRHGRRAAPLLAALDLGTNNCRLLIARPARDGSLQIVDSFSRIVRLGEGVALSSTLSEAAMERTVAALKVCAEHIKKHGVRRVRAVATEACRSAGNAQALVDRVAEETGISLSIVTPAEEARLAAVGCAPLVGDAYDGALAFDIGGGSTEVIWLRRTDNTPSLVSFASVPLGVMSLEEANGRATDTVSFAAMRASMLERFGAVRREMDRAGAFDLARHHLLGTSGTVTTLAGVSMGLSRYSRTRVDATWHDCTTIFKVVDMLVALDRKGRALLGCVGEERADLILAGCAIFSAIHELWPCAKLRVADRGLREGILRELMAEAAP